MDAEGLVALVLREALDPPLSPAEAPPSEAQASRRPISERFDEIRRQVPDEVQEALRELPTDFAAEHDHYLYGAPKNGA